MPSRPETLSFDELLEEVLKDRRRATEGSRLKTASAKKAFNRLRRESWAVGYRLAELLNDDDEEWASFSVEELWEGRTLDRKHVLRYSLQYEADSASGPIAERCCAISNALSAPFADRLPAAEIPDFIEQQGGIEKLIKAFRTHKEDAANGTPSIGCGADTANATVADNPAASPDADEDAAALEDGQDALPEAASASPPNRTVAYPAGTEGWFKVEVLVNAQGFDTLMSLEEQEEPNMRIKRVLNIGSDRKRLEGRVV